MSKVFVYGSLRQGGALNGVLSESEFVSQVRTKPEYTLYSLGAFPCICANGKTAVVGEVYEVSEATRYRLDQIEGHPHMYVRTPIVLEDGTEAEVYLFPYEPRANDVIEDGDWIKFHGPIDFIL